jgi:hypothetical protein
MANYDSLGFFVGMMPFAVYMVVRGYRLNKRLDAILGGVEEQKNRIAELAAALADAKTATEEVRKSLRNQIKWRGKPIKGRVGNETMLL